MMAHALGLSAASALRVADDAAWSSPVSSEKQGGTAPAQSSPGDLSRPADLHGLRRRLPDEWGQFLRTHFRGETHVAAFFDVDRKTARNWLSGKHWVNAAPLLMLIRRNPVARQFFLGEAA